MDNLSLVEAIDGFREGCRSDRDVADVLTNVAGDADLPGACDSERMPQIIRELQGLGLALR
jgi:hypothetical protein